MRDTIACILVAELPKRADPTERYWIYAALGEIGGMTAIAALSKGVDDEDEFARQAPRDALEALAKTTDSGTVKWWRRWWVFATLGFVVFCAAVVLTRPPDQPPASVFGKEADRNPALGPHIIEIRRLDLDRVEIRHNTPDGKSLHIIMSVPQATEQIFIRFETTY
jgi:hypothetical protein